MPVRLRRTAVLVVVLTAVWLLPSPDDAAAVQHHHKVHNSSFAPAPDGCLAEAPHRCFAAQTHIRNPDSNDALDDVDDRDLGSDPKPTPSVDGDIAVSDRDTAPPWLHAGRAADPRATSLIVWRKLAAPRPPPSL
jgi:hypothetical protein